MSERGVKIASLLYSHGYLHQIFTESSHSTSLSVNLAHEFDILCHHSAIHLMFVLNPALKYDLRIAPKMVKRQTAGDELMLNFMLDNTSSSAQAQMLFMALRSVIIPFIQAAVPNCPDLRNVLLDFEAENFLAALQKYVSCVNRATSHSDNQNKVTQTVDLEDLPPRNPSRVNLTKYTADNFGLSATDSNQTSLGTMPFHQQCPIETNPNFDSSLTALEKSPGESRPDPLRDLPSADIPREKEQVNTALTRLREHVFNYMPIRLLCFEKRGSKLDITLLDRAAIYSRLVPRLKDTIKSYYNQSSGVSYWSDPVTDTAGYAILSHTWLRSASGEVTYEDWHNLNGAFDLMHPGHQKLVNFCNVASEKHGLTLGWMDTVCINKASSAELDESIRSMYKWYEKAKVCITYLAETSTLSEMAKDPWFTRGWTLQELLAPPSITFHNSKWETIAYYFRKSGSQGSVQNQIELATTITATELDYPRSVSVSRKMQWAAKREVTREEDAAYSLMGIFHVSMSIAYGEGRSAAFIRLIKEILSSAHLDAPDIFNWGGAQDDRSTVSALLPSSPRAYLQRSTLKFWGHTLVEPLTLTHLGLRISILLLRASSTFSPANKFTPIGDYYATITDIPFIPLLHENLIAKSYNILDVKDSPAISGVTESSSTIAFGILNCGGDGSCIHIPEICFAVAILYNNPGNIAAIAPIAFGTLAQVPTKEPIVFSLKDRRVPQKFGHTIARNQLARHGMCLLNMYL